MKKFIIFAISLLSVCVLTLTGCGGETPKQKAAKAYLEYLGTIEENCRIIERNQPSDLSDPVSNKYIYPIVFMDINGDDIPEMLCVTTGLENEYSLFKSAYHCGFNLAAYDSNADMIRVVSEACNLGYFDVEDIDRSGSSNIVIGSSCSLVIPSEEPGKFYVVSHNYGHGAVLDVVIDVVSMDADTGLYYASSEISHIPGGTDFFEMYAESLEKAEAYDIDMRDYIPEGEIREILKAFYTEQSDGTIDTNIFGYTTDKISEISGKNVFYIDWPSTENVFDNCEVIGMTYDDAISYLNNIISGRR